MPGYEKWESDYNPTDCGLLYVDHCVGNVGWDRMIPVVKWYEEVMGFVNILSFDDKQINTEYSALMSKVMSNGNGFAKFPINEPAEAVLANSSSTIGASSFEGCLPKRRLQISLFILMLA